MNQWRRNAQELLRHYFRVAAEGGDINSGDCMAEIDSIVDNIIDAAYAEIMRKLENRKKDS